MHVSIRRGHDQAVSLLTPGERLCVTAAAVASVRFYSLFMEQVDRAGSGDGDERSDISSGISSSGGGGGGSAVVSGALVGVGMIVGDDKGG